MDKVQLTDETVFPDENVLKNVLGRAYNAYTELLKLYENNGLVPEWRYYKDGKAWLCKVQHKKRTIVWMSAWRGYINAAVYVPERLLEDIYNLDITAESKNTIKNTQNVGKSKPCIFEIRNKKSIPDLEKVMLFKIRAK